MASLVTLPVYTPAFSSSENLMSAFRDLPQDPQFFDPDFNLNEDSLTRICQAVADRLTDPHCMYSTMFTLARPSRDPALPLKPDLDTIDIFVVTNFNHDFLPPTIGSSPAYSTFCKTLTERVAALTQERLTEMSTLAPSSAAEGALRNASSSEEGDLGV